MANIYIWDLPSRRYWNHSSKKWEKVPEENICQYSVYHPQNLIEWEVLPYDRTEKDFMNLV